MTRWFSRRALAVACTLASLTVAAESGATSIFLRSANATAPVANDPIVTYYAEPSGQCATPFAAPFTAADFAAADAGPPALVVGPNAAWGAALACDPGADWISTGPTWPSRSTLYSVPFFVDVPQPCCLQNAKLHLCWMADDTVGDIAPFGGPNPIGVFINGLPTTITGGNYATQTTDVADITPLLHCGVNHLYIYNRDLGCAVSGLIFSARIDYFECTTPATETSWGRLRATYR